MGLPKTGSDVLALKYLGKMQLAAAEMFDEALDSGEYTELPNTGEAIPQNHWINLNELFLQADDIGEVAIYRSNNCIYIVGMAHVDEGPDAQLLSVRVEF